MNMKKSIKRNYFTKVKYAQMMELVDMLDSKSGVCKDVGVQVPLWVNINSPIGGFFYIFFFTCFQKFIKYSNYKLFKIPKTHEHSPYMSMMNMNVMSSMNTF